MVRHFERLRCELAPYRVPCMRPAMRVVGCGSHCPSGQMRKQAAGAGRGWAGRLARPPLRMWSHRQEKVRPAADEACKAAAHLRQGGASMRPYTLAAASHLGYFPRGLTSGAVSLSRGRKSGLDRLPCVRTEERFRTQAGGTPAAAAHRKRNVTVDRERTRADRERAGSGRRRCQGCRGAPATAHKVGQGRRSCRRRRAPERPQPCRSGMPRSRPLAPP